jgi:anti-anti-sigma factor
MQIQTRKDNGTARMVLKGRFDFQTHRDFRAACDDTLAAADVRTIEVDMDGVEYLDSSALGMLLLLRDKGKNSNKAISLANCRGSVRQVLDIANFGKIFAMR